MGAHVFVHVVERGEVDVSDSPEITFAAGPLPPSAQPFGYEFTLGCDLEQRSSGVQTLERLEFRQNAQIDECLLHL